jgi:hypothetical protein
MSSGFSQRTSISTPTIRPVLASTIGWYHSTISLLRTTWLNSVRRRRSACHSAVDIVAPRRTDSSNESAPSRRKCKREKAACAQQGARGNPLRITARAAKPGSACGEAGLVAVDPGGAGTVRCFATVRKKTFCLTAITQNERSQLFNG